MATYLYKAMTESGAIVRGRLSAANQEDLAIRLERMDLDLIRARQGGPHRSGGVPHARRHLIEFCFHLEQLVRSGVPLIEALRDLRDSADNRHYRGLIADIAESIETGSSLSGAMSLHPAVFNPVFLSLIAAGEHSGKLPDVLHELVDMLKWQDELAAHTKRLLLYPTFLGVLIASVFVFLLVYLVPKVAGFLLQLGHELPFHARILLSLSNFLVGSWKPLILGTALAVALIPAIAKSHPKFRDYRDGFLLRLPLLGTVLQKIILARLSSTLALMYGAGISILDALRLVTGTAGNGVIQRGLQSAERQIRNGEGLARAFENTGLFPPLVIRMLRMGESAGALDTALQNIAYFYSRDAKESVARMQVLMEPVLTVVLGILLGWIMLAVLGPVYDALATVKI